MSEKLISSINNSGIYAKVAGTALNAVPLEDILSSNSANWDGTYTTVSQNSASWGQGGDTSNCYPLTGGNLKGQITASGAGGASTSQSAPVYGKITATNKQNQAGLMTNGSVFAGDYNGTASQTIAVRRSAADSALAGRFQLYSDGAVSFQQIYNNGTTDSIVCQLQYGQTNTGFNWGTMASGTTVKHIAYTEDLTGQGKTYTGLSPVVVDNTTETGRISLTTSPITVDSTMTAYESAGNLVLGCVGGGKTYTGIDPIVVDNDAGTIGAQVQQFGHDDSLVHTADVNGYALGVNYMATSPKIGEETFAGYWNGVPLWQKIVETSYTINTSVALQTLYNHTSNPDIMFIDCGNSFIRYLTTDQILPTNFMLATNRYNTVFLNNQNGIKRVVARCVDSASVPCTAYLSIKYSK